MNRGIYTHPPGADLFAECWATIHRIAPLAVDARGFAQALGCQAPTCIKHNVWELIRPDFWVTARSEVSGVFCWIVLFAEVVTRTDRRDDPRFAELVALASLLLAGELVELTAQG